MEKIINNGFFKVLFMLVLVGCNHNSVHTVKTAKNLNDSDTEEWVHTCQTKTPISKLKKDVVLYGDTDAYWELKLKHMDMDLIESLLPYSLLMANKYDYPLAYFDVYNSIILLSYRNSSNHTFDFLDKKTLSLAIEYLKMGSDKGESNCMRDLGFLYMAGKYVKKDTVLGKQLIEDSRKK
jgi:hypothetical protein